MTRDLARDRAALQAAQDLVDALREAIADGTQDIEDMTATLARHKTQLEALEGEAYHMQNAVNLARARLAELEAQAAEVPDGGQ